MLLVGWVRILYGMISCDSRDVKRGSGRIQWVCSSSSDTFVNDFMQLAELKVGRRKHTVCVVVVVVVLL